MQIEDGQREVREVFMHGFPGQLVSGVLWLVSAALSTWVSTRAGIIFLLVGGVFIFPCTLLVLKSLGRRASLDPGNPFGRLGMQVAFTLPLNLPLVGAAAIHRLDWFYPATMLVTGTHYLPFVFMYGMPAFYALAAVLILGALALGLYVPAPFATGGWFTGTALLAFALIAMSMATRRRPA